MESKNHKIVKERLAKKYSEKGYSVSQEHRLENGMIADLFAEKDAKTVIIEVGTLNGEDRLEKLSNFADKIIHIPQLGKPYSRKGDFTTVSFKKSFIATLKTHIEDTHYSSVKNFLKHLAVKEMESDDEISETEVKAIAKKLKDLGYME